MATMELTCSGMDVTDVNVQEGSLNLTPLFYGNGGEKAPCVLINVMDENGHFVRRCVLQLKGTDLSLHLQDRSLRVEPRFERMQRDQKGDME